MSKSVIDRKLEYNNENWVVSLLIQDDKDSSLSKNAHVQICVEGLVNGRQFIGRYELHSDYFGLPEPRYYIIADNNQRNPRLKIDRFAYQFSYRKEVKLVETMIASIEAEAKCHKELVAVEERQINLPVYRRIGRYGAKDEQGRVKHSCATWANEKMKILSEGFEPKVKEAAGLFPFHPILRHPKARKKALTYSALAIAAGLFTFAIKTKLSNPERCDLNPKLG